MNTRRKQNVTSHLRNPESTLDTVLKAAPQSVVVSRSSRLARFLILSMGAEQDPLVATLNPSPGLDGTGGASLLPFDDVHDDHLASARLGRTSLTIAGIPRGESADKLAARIASALIFSLTPDRQ